MDADEVIVPRAIANRLTYPVAVQSYNISDLEARMRRGEVLFIQRTATCNAKTTPRMRAIGHLAVNNYVPETRDRLVRRGNKYPITEPPLPAPEDIVLPVQWNVNGARWFCVLATGYSDTSTTASSTHFRA